MIWYFLLSILTASMFVGIIYGYHLIKKEDFYFIDLVTTKAGWKLTGKVIAAALLVSAVLTYRQLWNTLDCSLYAGTLKTSGTYSWYYGECNLEPTKDGLIPKKRIIGSPNQGGSIDESN